MPIRRRKASDKYLSGEQVRVWRLSRDLTQPELGRWLGLTPQAVARYESVGATKQTALAFSAIDACIPPVKITKDDFAAAQQLKQIKKRDDSDEETGT
jgi:transcriptional regulator with XRE-family HTH domain